MNKKPVIAIILAILAISTYSCKKKDNIEPVKEPSFSEKFYKKWKLDTTVYVLGAQKEVTPNEAGDYIEFRTNKRFTYHADDTTIDGDFRIIGSNNDQVQLVFPTDYELADILNQTYNITVLTPEKLLLYFKGTNTETTFIMKQ